MNKYYFRKPKSAIARDVLYGLLVGGMVLVAATSPYFAINIIRGCKRYKNYPRKKVYDTFYQLRKRGLITVTKQGRQIYISLTKEGKQCAGTLQIDALKIARPKNWDKRWRILIFDIQETKKIYREALRGKLKELGFYPLQKSVWVCPFPCEAEVEILQKFFGLSASEFRLIVAVDIGDDREVREAFEL